MEKGKLSEKLFKCNNYISVPEIAYRDKDLIGLPSLLLGLIISLSKKSGYCNATDDYFSLIFCRNKKSIQNALKRLVKKKFIKRETIPVGLNKRKRIICLSEKLFFNNKNQFPEVNINAELDKKIENLCPYIFSDEKEKSHTLDRPKFPNGHEKIAQRHGKNLLLDINSDTENNKESYSNNKDDDDYFQHQPCQRHLTTEDFQAIKKVIDWWNNLNRDLNPQYYDNIDLKNMEEEQKNQLCSLILKSSITNSLDKLGFEFAHSNFLRKKTSLTSLLSNEKILKRALYGKYRDYDKMDLSLEKSLRDEDDEKRTKRTINLKRISHVDI